jgi:dTDP-4-amino-4,6-dideoxy-D-galactose acyltransferase
LEWDSEFFGVQIGHADSPHESTRGYDIVQMLVSAQNPLGVQEAEAHGYRFRDVRVTFARPTTDEVAFVRNAVADDHDELARIARESHRVTRFYADHGLPKERCDDLYAHWIRKSCDGWADAVLVSHDRDLLHGYVTVHVKEGVGSIGLIAVAEPARGQKRGENLVKAAVNWCHMRDVGRIEVVTQGRNISAQRVFQNCGFRPVAMDVWLSKWTGRKD